MELLNEQDLALVHSPELFEESYDYIYESEEEALYEDYLNNLNEDFEIEALSNFLAENFETVEIDYIFALTEALQEYLAENFEFSNENEINEAILLLDEESVFEILEDYEYSEGISNATYEDILESVQSIYDSSDVIEESILGSLRDTARGVLGLPPNDYKNIKPGKVYRGARPKKSKRANLPRPHGSQGRRKIAMREEYDFLMEQAAVLSTLKVANMLVEAGILKGLNTAVDVARGIGSEFSRARKQATKGGKANIFNVAAGDIKAAAALADKYRQGGIGALAKSKNNIVAPQPITVKAMKPTIAQRYKSSPEAGKNVGAMLAYRGPKGQTYGTSATGKTIKGAPLSAQKRSGSKRDEALRLNNPYQ